MESAFALHGDGEVEILPSIKEPPAKTSTREGAARAAAVELGNKVASTMLAETSSEGAASGAAQDFGTEDDSGTALGLGKEQEVKSQS